MSTPSDLFRGALSRWFLPGAVYALVGAGGKTTAMKRVAAFLADSGVKARLTTTTRVGIKELDGIPVSLVRSYPDFLEAFADDAPVRLIVSGVLVDEGKYRGVDPRMVEDLSLGQDTVLLVEGDGSRKRPMKAPGNREPVIPANTATVFALMGAAAFDEPIDEAHCYNHQKALALVGKWASVFQPPEIAALAADPEGARKGIRAGMEFRLLVNQGDIEGKRETAMESLRLARELYGIRGALVSFGKGELYARTDD